jgi:hypothetical protein
MENLNTVNTGTYSSLAADLVALGDKATQLQLEAVVGNQSITSLCAVGIAGEKLAGSTERAIGALFNLRMSEAMESAGAHWSTVQYRDTTPLAKKLQPLRDEFFAAHKGHSNPSTKFKRVRDYAFELANPKVTGDVVDGVEGEGEGEGTTSRTRDIYTRLVIELVKLHRAGSSADNDAVIKKHSKSVEIRAALVHIAKGLKDLGVPMDDEEMTSFVKSFK